MSMCYIVGAGEFYGSLCPDAGDLIIAADGGYDTLLSLGIRCDMVIGDMDSARSIPRGVETITVPVEKDETDTYLCYLEGVKRGYTEFQVYGGVGGREDHTFANYSLLLHGIKRGHRISLIGKSHRIFAMRNESITLRGEVGRGFSVFAFGGCAGGVSVTGGKYSAEGLNIQPDFPIGVSNEFAGEEISITVECGELLVMIEAR